MDERQHAHAKPAADPERGAKPLTQHQHDRVKKQETLNKQKVSAQEPRDRAETELHDIQQEAQNISSRSDLRPVVIKRPARGITGTT